LRLVIYYKFKSDITVVKTKTEVKMVIQVTPNRLKTSYAHAVPAVSKPKVQPNPIQVSRPIQGNTGSLECPRCQSSLMQSYNEPQCVKCGYVDYGYVPNKNTTRPTNLITTGTRYVIRYTGEHDNLIETLLYVQVVRLRNRAVYEVTCPFCDSIMEQSSLSGKRREIREERYKCIQGHRVSLLPNPKGSLGWK